MFQGKNGPGCQGFRDPFPETVPMVGMRGDDIKDVVFLKRRLVLG